MEIVELDNVWDKGPESVPVIESIEHLIEDALLETGNQVPILAVLDGDQALGAVWCEEDGGFFTLVVDPKHQDQGIGRKLLEALVKYGKKEKWENLVCDA